MFKNGSEILLGCGKQVQGVRMARGESDGCLTSWEPTPRTLE